MRPRLGLRLAQEAWWPRLLRVLGDGHWHPVRACALVCGLSAQSLHSRVRDAIGHGAPLQWGPGRGLRLRAPITPLEPLSRPIPTLTCLATDSTQTSLMQALRRGLAEPLALVAEVQHAGRGRHGRRWLTPLGGGVALSMAWPHSVLSHATLPAALPLRVGVALAQTCQRLGVRTVGLKWPNDLLVHGRKLGGILIEGASAGVVIGVGLNHTLPRAWARQVGQPVISLAELLGRRLPSRRRVIQVLLAALRRVMRGEDGGWQEAYARFDVLAGRPVRVRGVDGVAWDGLALGVTPEGALRVLTDQGERHCHAGEVSVRLAG